MEKVNNRNKFLKIVLTVFCAVVSLAGMILFIVLDPNAWGMANEYFLVIAVGACALLVILTSGLSYRKTFISLALLSAAGSMYFLMVAPLDKTFDIFNLDLGFYIICGLQGFLIFYALALHSTNGMRIINLGFRIAASAIVYYLLEIYFTTTLTQKIAAIYLLNSAITLLTSLTLVRKAPLFFVGMVLLFLAEGYIFLTFGGITVFGFSGAFVDFINSFNLALYTFVPALLALALSSAWPKKDKSTFQ